MNSELDEIDQFLKENAPYFERLPSGKVKCVLNGHELKPDGELLHHFVNGKKFRRLKQLEKGFQEIKHFEPFLIRSKNFQDKVFCTLTGQLIGVGLSHAFQHCEGQKFKKAEEKYLAKELVLLTEPEINDVLESLPQEELENALQTMDIDDKKSEKQTTKRNPPRLKHHRSEKKKLKHNSMSPGDG
eukprot:g5279.t1